MDATTLVSICCQAYNHTPFVRQCLDGFLMQKVNFEYEILIHDDASTDGTADIIQEYEAKYPKIIKAIYQKENQYSQDISIPLIYQFPRAKGKYIAMCEGDDYWTDPYKLQKQVDFLEENLDFTICCHDVKIKREKEGDLVDSFVHKEVPEITNIYDLAEGNYIYTPSVVFRKNQKVFEDLLFSDLICIDYVLHMLNAQYGKIKKIDTVMAVYRIHEGGLWSLASPEYKMQKNLSILEKMIPFFEKDERILNPLKKRYIYTALSLCRLYRRNNNEVSEIVMILEKAHNISPYNFFEEINNELILAETEMKKQDAIINKYRNTLIYKVYKKMKAIIH